MRSPKFAGAVTLAVTGLLVLGMLTATAQGPTGVAYLDQQPHTVPAGSSMLYRFDYAVNHESGERPFTSITMIGGRTAGFGFQVWTPDKVADMANNTPIGLGTSQKVDCATGNVTGSGACQSADLTWSGAFPGTGTYYVLVTNRNNYAADFTIKVEGSGVSLGTPATAVPMTPTAAVTATVSKVSVAPTAAVTATASKVSTAPTATMTATVTLVSVAPTAIVAATASRVPTATTSAPTATVTAVPAVANVDDPGQAAEAEGKMWSLAANSAAWFKFDYALEDGGGRPTKIITLANGNQRGVSFEVYTPDSIGKWWDSKPIGVGAPPAVDCSTGNVHGSGTCQSGSLSWSGTFGGRGTYYVRVKNANNHPVGLSLTVQ